MITQNSEVYNPPYKSFSIYVYNEERYVGGGGGGGGGIVYFVLCDHPYLVSYFLPFWYPYILQMFFIPCFFLAAGACLS